MVRFFIDRLNAPEDLAVPPDVRVIRGLRQMLPYADLLARLAARCAQADSVPCLDKLTSERKFLNWHPVLLLFVRGTQSFGEPLSAASVGSAVLLQEFHIFGVPTGIYAPLDSSGHSTLLAPAHRRAEFALSATTQLFARGAHAVLTSFEEDPSADGGDILDSQSNLRAAHCRFRRRTCGRGPVTDLASVRRYVPRAIRHMLARHLLAEGHAAGDMLLGTERQPDSPRPGLLEAVGRKIPTAASLSDL